ncbi:FK506-binding protein-like [Meriones unguiculatus]|uniref:FK506-binding protein-like n=1 Tax=Meriones unguiculatus TaxID=10047 RepID=UPI000B4F5D74|nr:FK506-binding protein-like [Meriones unguiculatus]XP_021518731.1 FK506-binding protein-like [Meriones unguiculatus]
MEGTGGQVETSPISPVKEKDTAQPQQREENAQKNLDATIEVGQQPPGPPAEGPGVRPEAAASQTAENPQESEHPVAGLEGDSAKSHETAEHLPASNLWYCPDGSFVKKITVRGQGLDKPKLGSQCRVLALGFPFGSGMPEGWTELTIGMGQWRDRIWGELTEKCLESMCEGEEAEIRLPGCSTPLFKLRLDSFSKGRDSWELEALEKEALAREEHSRGTELFRAGDTQGAARCYGRALRLLLTLTPPRPPQLTVLYSNLAACQLLLGQPQLAAQSCDRVLEREPGHLKALYRRGVAQAALGNLEKASADLKKVLAVDPKNRAAQEELWKVVVREKKQDAGLARGLRKMFS